MASASRRRYYPKRGRAARAGRGDPRQTRCTGRVPCQRFRPPDGSRDVVHATEGAPNVRCNRSAEQLPDGGTGRTGPQLFARHSAPPDLARRAARFAIRQTDPHLGERSPTRRQASHLGSENAEPNRASRLRSFAVRTPPRRELERLVEAAQRSELMSSLQCYEAHRHRTSRPVEGRLEPTHPTTVTPFVHKINASARTQHSPALSVGKQRRFHLIGEHPFPRRRSRLISQCNGYVGVPAPLQQFG